MDGITIFNSTDFGSVRTMEKNGEPYFCLSDICRSLDIKNVSDCKTRLKADGAIVSDVQTNGGLQKATFVNEGNLYRVIFQSKKPEAEKFTDWITEVVIPSIRKNGVFSINQNLSPQLQLMQSMVNQMAQQELEIRKANEKSEQALEAVSKMKDEILAPLGDWRRDVSDRVRTIAYHCNIPYQNLFNEMLKQSGGGTTTNGVNYEELENIVSSLKTPIRLKILLGKLGKNNQATTESTPSTDRSRFSCEKYKFFLEAPFEISAECCKVMFLRQR